MSSKYIEKKIVGQSIFKLIDFIPKNKFEIQELQEKSGQIFITPMLPFKQHFTLFFGNIIIQINISFSNYI